MTPNPEADLQAMLQREFRWLQRMTRGLAGNDSAAADDLAQDTLLCALAQPAAVVRRPRAWLRTIAANLWARQRRRESRRRDVETTASPVVDATANAPDEIVARTQLLGVVVEELLALGEPYRTALLLRFQEGLPLNEAAARLGVPVETLRTRQKRGLAQLRQRLDQRHGSRAGWVTVLGPAFAGRLPLSAAALPLLAMTPKLVVSLAAAIVAVGVAAVLWQGSDGAPVPNETRDATAGPVAPSSGAMPDGGVPVPTREVVAAEDDNDPESSRVQLLVTGQVVDEESGRAIAGATISWRRGTFADHDASAETVTSGEDGTFSLPSTARDAARQELVVHSTDHALFVQRLGTVPESAAADQPPVLDVGTIELPPGTGVHGEVVDARGQPVAGAELLLCVDPIWTTHGQRRMQLPRAFPQGRTDGAGRFTLPNRVCDRGPTYQPLLIARGNGGLGWAQLEVRRSRHESRDNRVALLPNARLLVRVIDERGQPLAGARVVAEPRFPPIGQRADFPLRLGPLESLFARVTGVGGDATFDLPLPPDVEAPAYALRVTAADRADLLEREVALAVERATTVTLTLTTSRTVTVRGRVVDDGGQAIAGAQVAVSGVEPVLVRTDTRGEYEATTVVDGVSVGIRATAAGHTAVDDRFAVDSGSSELRRDFTLEAALPLHGVVVDQHGEPVAGAVVHVANHLYGHVKTDDAGRFEVAGVPAARAASIHVHPPDGSNAYVGSVRHAARPDVSPLRLTLERLASGRCRLDVELVGASGERLEIQRLQLLHLERADGLSHPATPTLGAIAATGLRAGRWRLDVRAVTGPSLVAEFAIAPGQERCQLRLAQAQGVGLDVVFVLPEAAQLPDGVTLPESVTVRFAGTGQSARLQLADGSSRRRVKVDPRERAAVRVIDVDPGRALVVAAEADGWVARRHVAPGAVDGGEVRLELTRTAAVRFASTAPWPFDGFVLQFRHGNEPWGERMQFSGIQGATDLVRWPLPTGATEWQLTEPTSGADNAREPRVHRGTVDLQAGETAPIVIRPGR